MPSVLTDAQAAFIQGGASLSVASRDGVHRTSIARVLGCRVSAGGDVTLLVSASRSDRLLADVRAQRPLTMVASLPTTHETLQIKAPFAVVEPSQPGDAALVAAHVEAFAAQVAPIGYSLTFSRALLDYEPGDLIALRFTPAAVYMQTPGPRAGERLSAA